MINNAQRIELISQTYDLTSASTVRILVRMSDNTSYRGVNNENASFFHSFNCIYAIFSLRSFDCDIEIQSIC